MGPTRVHWGWPSARLMRRMGSELVPKALETLRASRDRLMAARRTIHRWIERFDPNTDPNADPVTLLPLLAILAATATAVWMLLRWKYQPMQDLGHHVALAAVVADYGRPGSLYTALYEPIDP